jgi:predicted permease
MQSDVEVWSPAGFRGAGGGVPNRGRRRLEGALARVQPNLTLEQTEARLHDYGAAVSRQFPADYPAGNGWRPRIVPLHEDLVGRVARPMFVLLSGVALLLLVACVNVAHLVLARTAARRQELAVRQALGATGTRLVGQLLTESALLGLGGGVLAVLVASWGVRGLVALAPGQLPRLHDVRVDVMAVALIGCIAFAVTVLFGVVPALRGRRAQVATDLKDGSPGRSSAGSSRARSILVAAEVAMATVLLVGAGLFVRTVVGLLEVPVGFETERLLTARITLPRPNDASRAAYLDHNRRVTFARETLRHVSAIAGVERAALSTQIPLGGFNPPLFVEIDGSPRAQSRGRDASSGARPVVHNFQVSTSYFETMGVPILAGRPLQDTDRAGGEPVAVLSETAARTFWPTGTAVGGRLRLGPGLPWLTVVGVAGDVLNRRLTEQPQPILYQPLEQSSDLSMALLIRLRPGADGMAADLARAVAAVDAEVPVYAVRTMDELIEGGVAQRRFLMRLLLVFGGLATSLALLGIYGVMSYSVSQRTREIGIRMAIGARQSDVARMVMRRGLALTASGAGAGILSSLALTQLVESQLFGVRPSDPMTIGFVLLLMLAVALFAAWWPARRAARVDPIAALRAQ